MVKLKEDHHLAGRHTFFLLFHFGGKMDKQDYKPEKSKRGIRHSVNPFLNAASNHTKSKSKRITGNDGNMLVINSGTGEELGPAGFWHAEEVDQTKFVKLYINGVKAFKGLTGAGTKVFEVLYLNIQNEIGKDRLWLTFPSINQLETPIGETTFYRGMKELLEKDFIAETKIPGQYFINPDYLWNGDRLAFVKEYRKINDLRGREMRFEPKEIQG